MDLQNTFLLQSPIAHRGLHTAELPENSMGAFENAIKYKTNIELDVHLLADGEVAVFHDETLQRLTGKRGFVKDLKTADLKQFQLLGTHYNIPTLKEVLQLVNGKVGVLIEIKNEGQPGPLEETVLKIVKTYNGPFAIMSFNPFSVEWFKLHAPEIIRGQLSSFFNGEGLAYYKKFILKRLLLNKRSQPHFIAYKDSDLPNRFVTRTNLPVLAWPVSSVDAYVKVRNHCNNIIFENFRP